jgi:predicted PurR-regulated permease PerM
MQTLRNPELYPVAIIGILTLIGFIVFWSVMDMVVVGASLAVVLMPLHHRLSARVRPIISASLITGGVLVIFAGMTLITYQIFSSNAQILSAMFSTIGTWLANPATNPLSYGVPVGKAILSSSLAKGNALFVDYQTTVVDYLPLILFKVFVFFFSLGALIFHGDLVKERFMLHAPEMIRSWVDRLSAVTVDTLYAIYVVQVAIAVLTFFFALPVFYILGYGNILFYSFFAAFCELIPVLGSSATFVLVGAYALALGDIRGAFILFILGYVVVSCVPEIWIRPVLVGRRVKINPVIMFIGIIGGILTMGLAGFVLGPVMIVLLIKSYRIYTSERRERRKISGSLERS